MSIRPGAEKMTNTTSAAGQWNKFFFDSRLPYFGNSGYYMGKRTFAWQMTGRNMTISSCWSGGTAG